MSKQGQERLEEARRKQSEAELLRKARKSDRRGQWTKEQEDYAVARAKRVSQSVEWD